MGTPEHGSPMPPPEADLIRLARQARGLSPEEAADRTPVRIKGFRWRQIESGYKGKAGASDRVKAPDKTLAHMANTVGVSADRLAATGRVVAAEILREIQRTATPQAGEGDAPDWLPVWLRGDARVLAIWNLKLPVEERIQGIRDLMEADLRRAGEQEAKLRRDAG